jgi:hypothetical protein
MFGPVLSSLTQEGLLSVKKLGDEYLTLGHL